MPQQRQAQFVRRVALGLRAGLAQVEAAAQHAAEGRVARQVHHIAVQRIAVRVQLRVVAEADARIDGGRDIAGPVAARRRASPKARPDHGISSAATGGMSASDSTAWIDAPT